MDSIARIEIVCGYNVIVSGVNGIRILWETTDIYEAFRIARRFEGCIEKTDTNGDVSYYYAETGNRIRSYVWE